MKIITIIVATTAIISFVALSFADNTAPAAKSTPPKAKTSAPAVKTLSGVIESIDAIGNTILVKTPKATDTIKVESMTSITVSGKKATLADLKAGVNVSVSYKVVDESKMAVSIKEKVKPAAAATTATPAAAK
jgi:Cu/Ag efflux protein CusF